MQKLSLLALILILAVPALAGDPGPDFWKLVEIRKSNWEIEDSASATAQQLQQGKLDVATAQARWESLLQRALKLKSKSINLESGEQPKVASEVSKMMRLQIARLEGLVKAARHESKHGLEAAKPLWARQLKSYDAYKKQEANVLDLMNWIEENP